MLTNDGDSGSDQLIAVFRDLYNSTAVDGANNNHALWSETQGRATGSPICTAMDSVQEFSVSTAITARRWEQAAGGITNAVTKSGTNMFHGDLFYYLRYPTLERARSDWQSAGDLHAAG